MEKDRELIAIMAAVLFSTGREKGMTHADAAVEANELLSEATQMYIRRTKELNALPDERLGPDDISNR